MSCEQAPGVDGLTPLGVNADDFGTMTGSHLAHPLAEDPVDADNDRVTRPHEIDERRLHAGRSSSTERKRQRVGSPEGMPETLIRLIQEGDELQDRGDQAPVLPAPWPLRDTDWRARVP